MSKNSYIKDTARYPAGAGTFTPQNAGVAVDADGAGTLLDIGTYTTTYNTPDTHISVSDFKTPGAGDGTALGELWQFRTQFETPPHIHNSKFSTKEAFEYLAAHTLNHSATVTPPYKWSQFRGAEAFFLSFVSGCPESAARRVSDLKCPWTLKCIMCLAWFVILALLVGAAVWFSGGTAAWIIGSALATGVTGGLLSQKWDPFKCYKWTYFRDGRFTVKITGGYSPTGKFSAYLGASSGPIKEVIATEGSAITFTNLRGSVSGDGGKNIGIYTLYVVDVTTKQSYDYEIFVPYRTQGSMFGIKSVDRDDPTRPALTFDVGDCSPTFTPSKTNAFWAFPTGVGGGGAALTGDMDPADLTGSTCTTIDMTLNGQISRSTTDVQWRFRWKKDCLCFPPPPAVISTPSVWTDVSPWKTETAATLIFGKSITDSLTGVTFDSRFISYKLELSSASGLITVDQVPYVPSSPFTIDTSKIGTMQPARVDLLEAVDNALVDLTLPGPTVTIGPKTFTTTGGIGGINLWSFNVTVSVESTCCNDHTVTVLEIGGDQDAAWWDQVVNPANAGNQANLPPVPAGTVRRTLSRTVAGSTAATTSVFTFTFTDIPEPVFPLQFTYVMQAQPTRIALRTPVNYWSTATDTSTVPPTTVTQEYYTVVTLNVP